MASPAPRTEVPVDALAIALLALLGAVTLPLLVFAVLPTVVLAALGRTSD